MDDNLVRESTQLMLSDEDFNKNFERILEYTKKNAIGKDGDYIPELHIFTKNFEDFKGQKFSETMVVFADFPDTHEKRCEIMKGLGAKMASQKTENGFTNFAFQVVFVCEMYFSVEPKEVMEEGTRVQDIPGRKERIMIAALSVDKRKSFAAYEVIKKDGKIIDLKQEMYQPYKQGEKDGSEPYVLYPFFEGFSLALLADRMKGAES